MSQTQLPNNIKIGFHLSLQGGVEKLFKRYFARSCTAFQTFLGSPRSWNVKKFNISWVKEFSEHRKLAKFPPYVVHTKYLLNLASANSIVRAKSIETLHNEYLQAIMLQADFIILHMGSHSNPKIGLELMRDSLEKALYDIAKSKPLLLLENTAGEKNDLGYKLEEIALLIHNLKFPVGVCFDTCHAFQAGYDLTTEKGRTQIISELRHNFSKDKIKVIHLNDSKFPLGSRKDRHEHIFDGYIGALNMAKFLMNSMFKNITVIFETPQSQGIDNPKLDNKNLLYLKNAFAKLLAKN